ncbi:MAG TPA: T9SS type A sorting domain-containing protein, partial [Phaeodactylibacter sp.]|nr:T9SS type A sorting domain-containing protein [Phaeodactylibacter sp.]
LVASFFFQNKLHSQTGCPGCQTDVPNGLVADTIYLDPIPDGTLNAPYDEDLSFRLPKTTTPVAANNPDITPGITLNEISITSILNLPPGLQWQTNDEVYFPATQSDGCVRLCGTPLAVGTYVLDIILEVKIGFLTQESSFQKEMVVLPSTVVNDGFTMTNNSGCGEVEVSFQNNISSNGNAGYSYLWNFGNGNTSLNENPNNQIYSSPGVYPVDYQLVIDTTGYILTNVKVISADCSDFVSPPDLYLDILDPMGNSTVTPQVDNVTYPVFYNFNMPLVAGNYTLVVKDEDGGLNGTDDECDFYTFNQLSNGILINGGSSIELTILHPVDTIRTTDSVYVYPQPEQPLINYETPATWCEDETITLSSSSPTGNQWVLDSVPIVGATEQDWQIESSGIYTVIYTNDYSCSAMSAPVEITLDPLPEIPIFNNSDNLLEVVVPGILPNDYSLQWYYENTILPNETELTYCLTQTGSITLVVTDNETGCSNAFTHNETFDPKYDCGVLGVEELVDNSLEIYPNPFSDKIHIGFNLEDASDFQITMIDLLGRKILVDKKENFSGDFKKSYPLENINAGVYLLEIDFGTYQVHRKIIRR